jgi:fluoroquinolone resistance protein
MQLIIDATFNKINYSNELFELAEYDTCIFDSCNFIKTTLSNSIFTNCEFMNCKFEAPIISQTSFKDILFQECTLLGLQFEYCNDFLFEVSFDSCILQVCSFFKMNLKNSKFKNSRIIDVDFSNANLTGIKFDSCDLSKSIFDATNLEKTDFSSAIHFSIHPENNKFSKTKFSNENLSGLLNKYDLDII